MEQWNRPKSQNTLLGAHQSSRQQKAVRKSKSQSGVGLQEVRPKTPKNDRIGRSHLISFWLRTRPGVRKIKKSKNQKVEAGLVLRKKGLRRQSAIGQAETLQLAFFCALDPALARKIRKSKSQKSQSGVGLEEVRHNTPKNNRMGRSPIISFQLRTRPGVSKKEPKNRKIKESKRGWS